MLFVSIMSPALGIGLVADARGLARNPSTVLEALARDDVADCRAGPGVLPEGGRCEDGECK
jgi:hypothetical protein